MYRLNMSLAVIATLMLTACAHGMRPTVATTLSPQLPPNAMVEPVALPVVADDAGLQELFINHIEVAGLYHALAAQHCALLAALSHPCAGVKADK